MPTIRFEKKGDYCLDLGSVRRAGIGNIADVVSHLVSREDGLTIHEIKFKGGGHCTLSYTSKGRLVEFNCEEMTVTGTKEDELILCRSGQKAGKTKE